MQGHFGSRIKRGWNAFLNRSPTMQYEYDLGPSYGRRPDYTRLNLGNERSIISSVYTRIAMDVAGTTIQHVRLDKSGRFSDVILSGLNNCFNLEANIDQTGRAFVQDIVMSMFDEGVVAIVPVETDNDPTEQGSYEILSLRTAKILQWFPKHVRLLLYNDISGKKEEIILPKDIVGIIENPLYAVMNEPNSTLKRLVRKLNLLDMVDEQSSSGKLDLIIQLPYVIKSEARRKQAEDRRLAIEHQLAGSKYGIAYTDGTERITQLNRPVENALWGQIEALTSMLYSQLGLTQSVFDGTADAKVLTNYFSRAIEPIVGTIVGEGNRKFLTKTARTQGQALYYFRDPFKFIPVDQIANMADKFTRNEILAPNEVRQIIGMRASNDPKADELRNRNISEPTPTDPATEKEQLTEEE